MHPHDLDQWALDISRYQANKMYFYETVTSMFLHYGFRHLVMNVIFAFFVMYEMEHCWMWSVPLALTAGFAANCVAISTLDGIHMGLSGAVCALVGIQLAALLLHCSYLRDVYGKQFYIIFFFGVLMLFMVIGFVQSALINFVGLGFGMLFGLAFYPRMPEASVNVNIDKVLKIIVIGAFAIAILLALLI
jgi:rhomboid protease GluP